MNTCPDCEVPVVWFHSPLWKKQYGKPEDYLRLLQGEDLKPTTPFQITVVGQYGHRGQFQNATQQREVKRLEKKYPVRYMEELLTWAKGKPFMAWVGAVKNTANLEQWNQGQDDRPAWKQWVE